MNGRLKINTEYRPCSFSWIGVAFCDGKLLPRSVTRTPFDGHAARVALVAKEGTTPVLVLHKNEENCYQLSTHMKEVRQLCLKWHLESLESKSLHRNKLPMTKRIIEHTPKMN